MKFYLFIFIFLGLSLLVNGQNTVSIAKLEEAVKSSPTSAEAWYKLGISKFHQTGDDGAKLAFEKALELRPDYAEAHVAPGAWYLMPRRKCALGADISRLKTENQSRATLAVSVLEKAIKLKPVHTTAFVYLGKAYASLKKTDKAAEAFEKAIEHGVKDLWILVSLANIYQTLGRNEDAIKLYRSVTDKSGPASDMEVDKRTAYLFDSILIDGAFRQLAELYGRLGQYDESLQTYKEIVRLRTDDASAHYKLGQLFIKLGDKQSAEREYHTLKRIAARTKHDYSRKEIARDAKELLDQIRKL